MIDKRNYLKRNKRAREEVAQQLGISKKQVQELIYNLLEHAEEQSWQVTEVTCEIWASNNTDSRIYKILDWDATAAERQAVIKGLLDGLSFIISKDNKVFSVEKAV